MQRLPHHFRLATLIAGMLFIAVFILPSSAMAEMTLLADHELASVAGQAGFVDFSMNTITDSSMDPSVTYQSARMEFNVQADIAMSIDSLKMGRWERSDLETYKYDTTGRGETNGNYINILDSFVGQQGSGTNTNNLDWDINWTDVKIGTTSAPVSMNGIILRADFEDFSNPATRTLRRITFGSNNVSGNISGNMWRTTGMINPQLFKETTANGKLAEMWWYPLKMKRDGLIANNWTMMSFGPGDAHNSESQFFISLVNYADHQGFEVMAGYPEQYLDFNYKTVQGDYVDPNAPPIPDPPVPPDPPE